ncbi:MAG: 50S ribosomal protein L11 methyltransferase [Chloroflexi bacterium]|jgi:predicted nicotinamide N-methyase|nr:50S ribosomal protein L11 methyltransferase [Chloroflexota bacterium]
MPTPSPADLRAFVRRHTRLAAVPGIPGVRLHLAHDVARVSRAASVELGLADADLPYWAFAWAGGLAIARHLLDHPSEVAGRTVVDVATGSGLCAIAASRAGAASVHAFDVDPLSRAAVEVNARANGVRVGFRLRDPLDEPPPPCDVLLAGDVLYQQAMAARILPWLQRAAERGTRVLLGDPGRTYLPPGLEPVATYRVHTSLELEDADEKASTVFTIPASRTGPPAEPGALRAGGARARVSEDAEGAS